MGATNLKYEITYKPWDDCTVFEEEVVSGYINQFYANDDVYRNHGIKEHNVIVIDWYYYDYDKEEWVRDV